MIDVQNLQTRLHNHSDAAAYALGTARGAVVLDCIHHLQASNDTDEYPELGCQRLASESETAMMKNVYQEIPVSTPYYLFFSLHIHSANQGQMFKALCFSVKPSRLLGSGQAGDYVGRSGTEVQDRLRIIWLLHTTERYDRSSIPVHKGLSLRQFGTLGVHATRIDLPCIFHLDARLPALHADETPFDLLLFCGMVQLPNIPGFPPTP